MNTEDNFVEPGLLACVLLGVVTIFMLVLAGYTLCSVGKDDSVKPPEVLERLLCDMTTLSTSEFHDVFPSYFNENSEEEIVEIQNQFEEVFAYFLPKVDWFTITASYPGFLEIVLLDKEGTPLYPRIAFSYKLNKQSNLIEDFSIARLQPFSRYDEEYNEAWG